MCCLTALPSRTAVLSAVGRALHADGPAPHVFVDELAWQLAGTDGEALARDLRARLSDAQLVSFSRWTSVRARFVEDLVASAVADGVDQYVILGAGLDSFAFRRHDLLDRLEVFEVDHPATQAWKLKRLTELGLEPPAGLAFVPVDFEQDTFLEVLTSRGFDLGRPAVVSWIGVTMYLSLDAIVDTLTMLAGLAAGSAIAITYDLPATALTGLQLEVRNSLAAIVSDLGEPFVTTFEPAEAESLLRRLGFDHISHYSPTDAAERYFAGERDVRVGGSQRLVVAEHGRS